MAQSNLQQPTDIVSTYPPPPAKFYTLYTNENIAQNRVPLPPPIPPCFNIFGAQYSTDDVTIRDLEVMGIQKVYNSEKDKVKEMMKLNMSILITFLDLLDLLYKSPTSEERIKKIEHLKVNVKL